MKWYIHYSLTILHNYEDTDNRGSPQDLLKAYSRGKDHDHTKGGVRHYICLKVPGEDPPIIEQFQLCIPL